MKIAIAGYGIEGESSYRYWSADPSNQITIVDHKQPSRAVPKGVLTIIGADATEDLYGFDLVIRAPQIRPDMIKTDGKIWSITNEFFAKCPAEIIGITGSKGKGTTASLVASILEQAGKKVWLIGNIGKPALDVLDQVQSDDIVVYELSSFQLWDIEKSPHIAAVLFIEQEHQNVHNSMQEYVDAKANITKYQTENDILVYNHLNKYALEIANDSKAKLIGCPDQKTAHIVENDIFYGEQKICSVDDLKITGVHNFYNACTAVDIVWNYTKDTNIITKGLNNFHGLPMRLQFIRQVNGVSYYDDSIATTPGSAIVALQSFNTSKVVILGGSNKGSDYSELAVELTKHDVQAILIGEEAQNIANECITVGFSSFEIATNLNMSEIVKKASQISKPGGVVLLSPACASFGMFKDYADRGQQFDNAVRNL